MRSDDTRAARPCRPRATLTAATLVLALSVALPPTAVDAAAPLPRCTYSDRATKYARTSDWYRTLVDTAYRLPKTYAPSDLVSASRSGAPATGSVRAIIIPDLKAMYRAALAAGAPFAVKSPYRSYANQVATFNGWVRKAGMRRAELASARPGHSEHQLGTSFDVTSPARFSGGRASGIGKGAYLYADWGTTKAGTWLARNSWKYGFLLSYPKVGSPQKTCYKYEPWHFRFFGRRIAAEIHRSGLTPREWLWANGAMASWTGGSPTGAVAAAPAPPLDPADEAALPVEPEADTDVAAPTTDTVGPSTSAPRPDPVTIPIIVGLVALAWALMRGPFGRPPRGARAGRRFAPEEG